jgi:F0F1-type ATP synthase assembly protein I
MPFNRAIPESKPRAKPPGALATLVEAEKMIQIAFLLPCSVLVGWLAGAWADSLLHQSWIALVGIIFGGFAGLVYVGKLVMAAGRQAAVQDGKGTSSDNQSGTGKGSSETKP